MDGFEMFFIIGSAGGISALIGLILWIWISYLEFNKIEEELKQKLGEMK